MAIHTHTHTEQHYETSERVRDIVIGMADGLTVPFALAAGVSGASAGADLVITAGLAEIAAGSIAMGLGGYLAARTDRQHYQAEQAREEYEIIHKTTHERGEIIDIMAQYGVSKEACKPLVAALEKNPTAWRDFMMRFELGLEEPNPTQARNSALTIGLSYILGGMIPLLPYMLIPNMQEALIVSAIATLCALFCFGFAKGRFTGTPALASALQTLFIGGLAASVAFGIARWIG
ncbi:VIT1/CCC1 transporter family protein [Ampullimonas aquatilis]|uniref:VIT1/CCC1 transporter family protein n=1 Tax=Ampullimonas aquatilis TaxID=1341549 RepID=UPI003C741503